MGKRKIKSKPFLYHDYPFYQSIYDPKFSRHCEYLMREKEVALMASRKRPPMSWNGKKPLKFSWALFLLGERYSSHEIRAYNIEEQWFDTNLGRVTSAKFLVKRLD